MKKKFLALLVLIVVLVSMNGLSVFGYSNELYEITLPDGYTSTGADSQIWQNDDMTCNYVIYTAKNTESFNTFNVDDDDLKEYEETCIKQLNDEIKSAYGDSASVTVNSIKTTLEKINDYSAVLVDMNNTYQLNGITVTATQYAYCFSSQNNIYNITFTSSGDNAAELDKAKITVNSFVMKDDLFTDTSYITSIISSIKPYIVPIFIAGGCFFGIIVGVVIALVLKNNKRKKLLDEQFNQQETPND